MTTEEIQNLVIDYASACGVDPTIAFYQIQRESGFNPNRVGADGELGIAQFLRSTWGDYGEGPHENARNPHYAMNAYCRYMTYLLGLFGGNYEKALQGYNGGEGNVQRGTVSARARAYARDVLAQARAQQPDIGPLIVTPGGFEQIPDWLKWAGLGLVGVLVWSALSD